MRYARDGHSIETLIERGVPFASLPEWYRESPEPRGYDHIYLDAFWRLSTMRQIGMGAGPIPVWYIDQEVERRGFNGGTAQLFELVIRSMDGAYLEWSAKQVKKARDLPTQDHGNKKKERKK